MLNMCFKIHHYCEIKGLKKKRNEGYIWETFSLGLTRPSRKGIQVIVAFGQACLQAH
jgi:hypothetical protein